MVDARRVSFRWGRVLLMAGLLGCLTPLWLTALLYLPSTIELEMGPGDRDYRQGLNEDFRSDDFGRWREMGRRARLHLPFTLEGPGTIRLKLVQPDPGPIRLRIELDAGPSRELSLPATAGPQEIAIALPPERVRASLRLRSETPEGDAGRLRLYQVAWQGENPRPQRVLAQKAALLVVMSFAALVIAGASPTHAFSGSLLVMVALTVVSVSDPQAALHLMDREASVAVAGLLAMALLRWRRAGSSPGLRSLFYGALLLKSAFLFHPRFFFFDYPIHETLLELVYHRGSADFWLRLPEYQVIHNLGVAPVGGVAQPFPYPVIFYLLAHLGNLLVTHQPELWLKLVASLLSSLVLFPLGALARRLTGARGADLFAGVIYLLLPGITRSLLLLEFSALAGHLIDLILLAHLARISLKLDSWRKGAATTAWIALACATYPGGFLHQGLLVPSCLLFLWMSGAPRSQLMRLALAGIAGASLALCTYHPRTLSILFSSILVTGVSTTSAHLLPTVSEQMSSALHRIPAFLGLMLPPTGLVALGWLVRQQRQKRIPPHPWLAAWALAASAAYLLRFILVDLMRYQKELYWLGALLTVGTGVLVAELWSAGAKTRWLAAGLLLGLTGSWLWELDRLIPRFYRDYLFL